jgi:glutamine---fructose-6-phosphate transaminase (isomerizing)
MSQFLREIGEQGAALERMASYYAGEGAGLLKEAGRMVRACTQGELTFTGMGTSQFAPEVIREKVARVCQRHLMVLDAGEFLHYSMPGVKKADLLFALSQSGESIEPKQIVEALAGRVPLVALTNNLESTMGRKADLALPMLAGAEASISTKTYTNTVGLLLLLGEVICGNETGPMLKRLTACARAMTAQVEQCAAMMEEAADFLGGAQYIHLTARGPALVAMLQAELTWMEGTNIPVCGLTGGTFRHGPIEMAGNGHHLICYAADDAGGRLVEKVAREVAGLGSRVVMFCGYPCKAQPGLQAIELTPGDADTFTLMSAVPQELLLNQMAARRNKVAGIFGRIGKVTMAE